MRGSNVAGTVEAVGRNVTRLRIGDEVFERARFLRGVHGCRAGRSGAQAGQRHVRAGRSRPASRAHSPAGVRDQGKVLAGQKVLINGAWGGVGTFAVQIAKSSAQK